MVDGKSAKKLRIVSGIQSSGEVHLGNYFGAMRSHIDLQKDHECFYFIANYHALTTVHDGPALFENSIQVAASYLALGLDPQKVALYNQSDIPEVCELAWILSTVTGMGLLDRAHSYKDKISKGLSATVGLYTYPILMAADILIVGADKVPVGEDQVQHLEMTRDMAGYFNNTFKKQTLKLPEVLLSSVPKVSGIDGQKMSKSYGNAIEIFAPLSQVKKKIMSIVTDSTPVEAPKDSKKCNAFHLLKLLADAEETKHWESRYVAGGMGYGEVKQRILALFEEKFGKARQEREKLLQDRSYVNEVLKQGAKKVRGVADPILFAVRKACGLV